MCARGLICFVYVFDVDFRCGFIEVSCAFSVCSRFVYVCCWCMGVFVCVVCLVCCGVALLILCECVS